MPLFEKCPHVDEIIDFRTLSYERIQSKRHAKLNKVIRIFKEMFSRIVPPPKIWDTIICPVRSISKPMLWLIKNNPSKRKIGITGCTTNFPENQQYLKTETFSEYMIITHEQTWQHELTTNYQFLKFLGADLKSEDEIYPEYWFDEAKLPAYALPESVPYTLLIPYGSLPHKEVSNERYLEVVAEKAPCETVIIAGISEDYFRAERLKIMLTESGKKVANLCGKTTLIGFEQLIRKSESVIAIDTGGLHFAIALRKKTFCIVGGGHWGRFFPWGDSSDVHWLNRRMDCYRCDWICKYGDFRCTSNLNLEKRVEDY